MTYKSNTERMILLKYLKIYLFTYDLKIILFVYQTNYVHSN